jgi:hypothetical protein
LYSVYFSAKETPSVLPKCENFVPGENIFCPRRRVT